MARTLSQDRGITYELYDFPLCLFNYTPYDLLKILICKQFPLGNLLLRSDIRI